MATVHPVVVTSSHRPGADRVGPRSPALDGLRTVAVAAVVYRHLAGPGLPGGGNGVVVFFTLSGFIITYLLCVERERTGRVHLRAFWARRARRLLPALGICVVGSAALEASVGVGFGTIGRQVAPVLLYVSNWWRVWVEGHPGAVGLGPFDHTWSLSIEEQFYLGWPLLFVLGHRYLGHRPRRLVWVILGLAELSAVVRALSWDPADPGGWVTLIYNRTDTEAEPLLVGAAAGVLTWMITRQGTDRHRLPAGLLPAGGAAGVLLIAGALAGQPNVDQPGPTHLFWTLGLTVLALGVAVLCAHVLVNPTAALARVLAVAPLPQLGRISYGVYLYHFPILLYLYPRFVGQPVLGAAVVVVATLVVSAASWRYVERPALTWRRRTADSAHPHSTDAEPRATAAG